MTVHILCWMCVCVCFLYVFSIVVWNIETKQAICGSPASANSTGHCLTVQYSNRNNNIFVSAGRWVNGVLVLVLGTCISLGSISFFRLSVSGSGTLRVWELDLLNRKIKPAECQTGKLKRIVKCVEVQFHFQYSLALLPLRLINPCSFGNTPDYDITQWHFGLSFHTQ